MKKDFANGPKEDKAVGLNKEDQLYNSSLNDELYGDAAEVILDFESLFDPDTNPEPTIYGTDSDAGDNTTVHEKIPQFDDDELSGGNGHDKLYGDTKTFEINISGADDVPDSDGPVGGNPAQGHLNAFVLVKDLVVHFSNDTLMGGNGNDELYGDVATFTINIRSGENVGDNSEAAALLGSDIGFVFGNPAGIPTDASGLDLIFGNDSLYGGNGQDKLYGDAKDFSLNISSGSNAGGRSFSWAYLSPRTGEDLELTPILFGSDHLEGGNGEDELYGDVKTLNLNFSVGANGTQNNAATAKSFEFGNDELHGGKGQDLLIGDVDHLSITFLGGDNNTGPGNQDATAQANGEIIMGQDILYGGEGDDYIYGDIRTYVDYMKAGDNLDGPFFADSRATFNPADALYQETRMQMGNTDWLYGGKGNDHLYGDVGSISMNSFGGDNATASIAGGSFSFAGHSATIIFGGDFMYGEQGDDELIGDAGSISIHFVSGNNIEGSLSLGSENVNSAFYDTSGTPIGFLFGNDNMWGDSGNDLLVGDVKFLQMEFYGGQNANTNSGINAYSQAGISTAFEDSAPTFFGEDHLNGGAGIDLLYGEGILWSIDAISGSSANPSSDPEGIIEVSAVINSPITLGGDHLYGDEGDDILYGDWETIVIFLKDGVGSNPDGSAGQGEVIEASIREITFGDDVIDGGAGSDIIVGDVLDVNHSHVDRNDNDLGNSFVEDIDVTWGNDVLTGGEGLDKFIFEIQENNDEMQMQGHDTITDLDAFETLEFLDVLDVNSDSFVDLNDLNEQTDFSSINDMADLEISFHGGGSLTLSGYGDMNIDSFDDLVAAGVVISISG